MAEKLSVTRAEALEIAIDCLETGDTWVPSDEVVAKMADAVKALRKMHASITKPREKSNEPSRAAKENLQLAAEVLKVMPADEPVLTSWIMEHVNGIMTSQKCSKVMEVLIKSGRVEKVAKVKGRYVGYKLV